MEVGRRVQVISDLEETCSFILLVSGCFLYHMGFGSNGGPYWDLLLSWHWR